jgi:tellurite resistance protein
VSEKKTPRFDRLVDWVGDVGGKVASATAPAREHIGETAGKVQSGAKLVFEQAADHIADFKDEVTKNLPGKHKNGVDISALSETGKLYYCRVLVRLAFVDGNLDPREIANLYLFASIIGLEAEARSELRRDIQGMGRGSSILDDARDEALALAEALRDVVDADEGAAVFTSLVRDLVRISRADKEASPDERSRIVAVAKVVFPFTAAELVATTEELVEAEEKFAEGKITTSQLEKTTKDLVARAAAIGAPIAAVSLLGSVSGLGAAGITSGLAALGFGGVLGLSSMVTGIGVAVLLGVGVFVGVRYLLGFNERERESRRERLIQQVLANHQQAIAELSDDISAMADKVAAALDSTADNEERLTLLRDELSAFQQALATLSASRDAFEQAEPIRVE